MNPACLYSTFHFDPSTLFAYEVIFHAFSSADIFFKISLLLFFLKYFSVISVECQAVWNEIMPVGPDLGLNCLQRLSADDTSK